MKFIGVDLGGTSIKLGLIDENGNIIHKDCVPTPVQQGFEGVTAAIYELMIKILRDVKMAKEEVKAAGVGIPGVCSYDGFVYTAINLFWRNVPLSERLREITGLHVYVENDATVAAMGEAVKGATAGAKNSIFLTLGTGIGGGMIINHQIYSGSHGIGSEIGHMIVGENDYDCNCGNNGCLETFSSATALVKYTKRLLEDKKENSVIQEMTKGDLSLIDAKLIFDCAKEEDTVALKAVDRMIKYLAIGIGNLINLLDPQIIAIGGGMSRAGTYLIERLEKEAGKNVWFRKEVPAKLVLARLGNDAGIIGSAMYAKARFMENFKK